MLSGCSSADDLADLGPEQGQRFARQRGGGIDDDGDGIDALRVHRGQIEAAVDETPVSSPLIKSALSDSLVP